MTKVVAALAAFSIALLPLAVGAQEALDPSGERVLTTNAEGGVFPAEKRYWFSVPEGERLRLVLDGVQTYLGTGPASVQLVAKEGEERRYELIAERRSANPEDALLETRGYQVVVDAAPPASPVLRGRIDESLAWTLGIEADSTVRVDAVVEEDGVVSSRTGLDAGFRSPARSLSIVAWAVDAAGNRSAPVTYAFEPFSLRIANPVEGTWTNRQILLLEAEGARELFWTDDGSDPLGPSGRRWEGPVLVGKVGTVHVRAAARTPDGRVASQEINFRVEEDSVAVSFPPDLERAMLAPIRNETRLPVPATHRWDIASQGSANGSLPLRFEGGGEVALRPVAFVSRTVALHVGDGKGLRRYAFILEPPSAASALSAVQVAGNSPAQVQGLDPAEIGSRPSLYGVGAARVLAWPRRAGRMRYRSTGDGQWRDVLAPVAVGSDGGKYEWIVDKGGSFAGPFSLQLEAVPAAPADGELALTVASGGASREKVLVRSLREAERIAVPLSFSDPAEGPGGVRGRGFSALLEGGDEFAVDVCDGEELRWFVSGVAFEIDRRPPEAPRLSAPDPGSWLAEPPLVGVEGEGIISAVIKSPRADGSAEEFVFTNSIRLPPSADGPVSYEVSAYATDAAGNRSRTVSTDFVVDSSTLHVRSAAIVGKRDGSRSRPFASLDEALTASRSSTVRRILVSGPTTLNASVELKQDIELRGGHSKDWIRIDSTSTVLVKAGAFLHARGSLIEIDRLDFAGEAASGPILSLTDGARATVADSSLSGVSTLAVLDGSSLSLRDCIVRSAPLTSGASVAIQSRNGSFSATRVRLENEGSPLSATMIEATGGRIELNRVVVVARAKVNAICMKAHDVEFFAREVDALAEASSYASAFDSTGGRAEWKGGSLSAKARDVALLSLDTAAILDGLRARVEASGVARAVHARLVFPTVESSAFIFAGKARGPEAFAGGRPRADSIASNTFEGFDFLWEREFRSEELAAFNLAFAPAKRPNAVIRLETGR